jgi:hypothetical protein
MSRYLWKHGTSANSGPVFLITIRWMEVSTHCPELGWDTDMAYHITAQI